MKVVAGGSEEAASATGEATEVEGEASTASVGSESPEQEEAKCRELRERGLQLPSYADADLRAALEQLKAIEGVDGRAFQSFRFQLNFSVFEWFEVVSVGENGSS